MSNILIYDVAAESGGALSVLNEFYQKAKNDLNNKYFIVVSIVNFEETENIKILKYPWVKKTWFHRLFMDIFFIKRVIKKYRIDEILSLQNHCINGIKVKQSVYVHNAIPFCEHRFKLIHDPFLWFYQNIIGLITKKSLKKADGIIVQNEWMKNAIIRMQHINPNIVHVLPIKINLTHEIERIKTDKTRFFYPATAFAFKNHKVIIDAVKALSSEEKAKIEVVFTIFGNENKLSRLIKKEIEEYKLPIQLVGTLDFSNMKEYYKSSYLLFPSYVETVGLPLIEAQYFNAPIIAADLEYARCSVGNYKNALFFNYNDSEHLLKKMKQIE
ncbi:glycosyl transferase group 1 [Fibrobacter succinogenes subsp. succinogenes S85]|nr:glycosyltransferase [Fibrobacter succinogenes]ACX76263.1 glycosyl transferase group 1 [Fibrobacter succinogenes subsp. succinogenes S85]